METLGNLIVSGNTVVNGVLLISSISGSGVISSDNLADSSVTSAKIVDATIAAGDLADNTVSSAKIVNGTIVADDMADNAVNSAKIVNGAIVSGDLAVGAVTSGAILDGTISPADIANSAVQSAAIDDGTISAADIASNAVTASEVIDATDASGLRKADIGVISTFVSINPPEIAAQSCTNVSTTLIGAQNGDLVIANSRTTPGVGIIAFPFDVATADTIDMRFCNTSSSASNGPAVNWRVLLIR